MSKTALEPTWFALVSVESENGIVAYNEGTPLWRKWLPRNMQALAGALKFMSVTNNVVIGAIGVSAYHQLPREQEYRDSFKEEKKPTPPVARVITETRASPNSSKRENNITQIILHNTAGKYDPSVSWLCNPVAQASAHLVIGRDGRVARLVSDGLTSWHAGSRAVNHSSIGIEIEAYEGAEGMTPKQEEQVIAWVKYYVDKYGIVSSCIKGHREVSATSCPELIWKTNKDMADWIELKIFSANGGNDNNNNTAPTTPSGYTRFGKGNKARLATNFTADEFTCKCKNTSCINQTVSIELVDKLQKLRNHLGKAVNITSAYRCVAHNSSVGGANGSQHTKGHACDIYVSGMTAKELALICKQFRFTGIICYKTSGFVHVSVLSNEGFYDAN